MGLKIKPKFHRVLVRPVVREKSKGGIIIPDTAKEKDQPILGEVIAVGDGTRPPHYKQIPMQVAPGDRIVFRKHAGRHVNLDVGKGAEDLRFIAEEDIDAVFDKGTNVEVVS